MRWTDEAIRAALRLTGRAAARGAAGEPCGEGRAYEGVSTDTRTLRPGMVFVALRGENHDAHDFLGRAAEAGATAAVVERVPDGAPADMCYYVVDDTLVALGRLGNYRRRRLSARVCAITGTNGKTTTKELCRAVLGTRYRVHATTANLNNQVGTPLTLLEAPDDAEVVIAEVGTNTPGEIARLRDIVEPDVAIITGVAEGHLEGLGSVEGVLIEKTSLLERLGEDGIALVADTPPELPARARTLARGVRVAGMTERADADLRADDVALDPEGRLSFRWRSRDVRLGYRGRHNASNALLALGLGEQWDVDLDRAVEALAAVEPQKMRNEIKRIGALTVIADCYNANPPSTRAALDLLVALPHDGARVAVLGTMKELGRFGPELHRRILGEAAAAGLDLLVVTGDYVAAVDDDVRAKLGERLVAVEDPIQAFDAAAPRLDGTEIVLLKGSRGVALERLLPKLETLAEERGTAGPARPRTRSGRADSSVGREAEHEAGRDTGRSASAPRSRVGTSQASAREREPGRGGEEGR